MKINAEMRLRAAPLVDYRRTRGLTQKQLAEKAGVTVASITNLECMRFSKVTLKAAEKVSLVTEIPLDDFYPEDVRDLNIPNLHQKSFEISLKSLASGTDPVSGLLGPSENLEREDQQNSIDRGLRAMKAWREDTYEAFVRFHGFDGHSRQTQKQIAASMNLSSARIGQIIEGGESWISRWYVQNDREIGRSVVSTILDETKYLGRFGHAERKTLLRICNILGMPTNLLSLSTPVAIESIRQHAKDWLKNHPE